MINPGMLLRDRYRVIRRLGEGGLADTFEVEDGSTLKVLKVLRVNYHKAIALFQREAKVLARLQHPGIPKVEPDGYFTVYPTNSAEPVHCMVMEKIEGHNLEEWLKNNQAIGQDRAINWLKQLAEILDKIHQQHYFHRDIKPSNIMLKPDGNLVLIDFGAVREVTATYLVKIGEKREGTRIGTAGYMPLEQVDGEAVPQSDFFALGRTFVYLITGEYPLDFSKNPQTGELIWRDSVGHILPQFADLIDWLMAVFPGNRPQNARAILQKLEKIATDREAIAANSIALPSRVPDAIVLPNFRRFKVSLVKSTKIVAIVISLILGLFGLRLASPQMANSLHWIGYENYIDRQYKSAEFYLRWALRFNSELVTARYNLGLACEDQKKYDCARTEYAIASSAEDDYTASSALNNLGRLYIILDKNYDVAISLLLQGLKRAQQVAVKSDLHKNMGWAYLEQTRYGEAEERLRKAIALDDKNALAYCLLAQVREARNDLPGALTQWENCRQYGDDRNPDEYTFIVLARQRLEAKSN